LGDRNRLCEHYGGMASGLAKRFRSRINHSCDVAVEDMRQWAVLGLLDAVEGYREGRGAKFETYAYRKMWCRMMDGMREQDGLSRVGRMWARKHEKGSENRKAVMAGRLSESRRFTDCRDGDKRNEPLGLAEEGVEPELDGRDEWNWLTDRLSRRTRLMMALYYREGMTLKDVAAMMGCSPSRVSQLLARGRGLIRGRIETNGADA